MRILKRTAARSSSSDSHSLTARESTLRTRVSFSQRREAAGVAAPPPGTRVARYCRIFGTETQMRDRRCSNLAEMVALGTEYGQMKQWRRRIEDGKKGTERRRGDETWVKETSSIFAPPSPSPSPSPSPLFVNAYEPQKRGLGGERQLRKINPMRGVKSSASLFFFIPKMNNKLLCSTHLN